MFIEYDMLLNFLKFCHVLLYLYTSVVLTVKLCLVICVQQIVCTVLITEFENTALILA